VKQNTLKTFLLMLSLGLLLWACAPATPAPTPTSTPLPPPPTAEPTATPLPPTPTTPPTDTPTSAAGVHIPNLENGEAVWNTSHCIDCHGPVALGGIGPQLASTQLSFDDFLLKVRTAIPPKPAFDETQLPEQSVFDVYAWVKTQIPPAAQFPEAGVVPGGAPSTGDAPSTEEVMGMTIWTCRQCDSCHGIFAQGGPEAPTLAGLNYPVEEELTRMRDTADTIPEHSVDHISDEIFERLYKWIEAGCVQAECYQ
jgi:mono/diheme cytochrome c family protein